MRRRAIRTVVIAVCGAGIAGMIVASATNHNGAAITFGLVTAVAVLCEMVSTTVTNELLGAPRADVSGSPAPGSEPTGRRADPGVAAVDEDEALALERYIGQLVRMGADEDTVRDLVRRAVRLGRSMQRPPPD